MTGDRAARLAAYALALLGLAWLEQLAATATRAAASAHMAAQTADEALLEHLLGPCSDTDPGCVVHGCAGCDCPSVVIPFVGEGPAC